MTTNTWVRDEHGCYEFSTPPNEEAIFALASSILEEKFSRGSSFTQPEAVKSWLCTRLARYEHEVFCCMFLDTKHRLIRFEEMFRGTLDGASVYPREIVKRALELNAGAVIFSHNHPSGIPEPSSADQTLTKRLKAALALLDIRVIDHIIVGGNDTVSFSERGLL